ncbi:MAG: PAS domain-containing protein [Alphaproteobacteria bacterium]
MDGALEYLFGAASFLPHGYCLLWRPDLVALHGVSDAAIAAAYLSIPVALVRFAKLRPDLDANAKRILGLFIAFIVACAVTHLAGLLTLWFPYYGLHGIVKALTAGISMIAAIACWRLLPSLITLPLPENYRAVNARLQQEVAARQKMIVELEASRAVLNRKVADADRELQATRTAVAIASDDMPITIFEQDADLRMQWISNPLVQDDEADIIGKTDDEILPVEKAESLIAAKRRVLTTTQSEVVETLLPTPTGERLVRMHITPRLDDSGATDGIIGVTIDVTDLRDAEARREELVVELTRTLQRLNVVLEATGIFIYAQDRELRYLWASAVENDFGITVNSVQAAHGARDDELTQILQKQQVMDTGIAASAEMTVKSAGSNRWYDVRIVPNRETDDTIAGVLCVVSDITVHKQHEDQMRVVMRELSHRSKNLMAVIQAIVRQSSRDVPDVDRFVNDFSDRLKSIAIAQDLIVVADWGETMMRDLIDVQVGSYRPEKTSQLAVSGPKVLLSANATQTLSMAFHELATNAIKYGAFSVPQGRVDIDWSVDEQTDAPTLRLTWRERDGPTVAPPSRHGFGRTVIEENTAIALDADVTLDFAPGGLLARFDIPVASLH